ncbi:MAG: diguanylate cyclase [Thermoleophilia bacterium]|nr:diguanylate cyclase [Thermoleophilia bacterium]
MAENPQQLIPGDPVSPEIARLRKELQKIRGELVFLRGECDTLAVEKANLEKRLREYSEMLEQKVKERTRDLEAINEIATTVSRSLQLDVILRDSLAKVLEVLELDAGAVFLTDERKRELRLMVQHGLPQDVVTQIQVVPLGNGCPGGVVKKGEPLLINDCKSAELKDSPLARYPEFKAMAGIPLESKGRARGVFCLISRNPNRFREEDLKMLVTIGSEIGVAIENAGLYEKSHAHSRKMEELSITDSLTGLHNRRQFYRRLKDEMKRARRQRFPVSLLVLDLDNLKSYNDRMGHLRGDEALRAVAEAITASIRQDVDSGYRYGGDEFAVILPYSTGKDSLEVAERIQRTFNDFRLENTGLSIGLTELDHDEEIDDFVTRADSAMYTAKGEGGNRVHVEDF